MIWLVFAILFAVILGGLVLWLRRGTTLSVSSTEGFPEAGHLTVTLADGTEETVRYTGKTAGEFKRVRPSKET